MSKVVKEIDRTVGTVGKDEEGFLELRSADQLTRSLYMFVFVIFCSLTSNCYRFAACSDLLSPSPVPYDDSQAYTDRKDRPKVS